VVAIAQIMKYHEYPPSLSGEFTYNANWYGELTWDNDDWCGAIMQLPWLEMDAGPEGSDAAAELMYAIGVSMHIYYPAPADGGGTPGTFNGVNWNSDWGYSGATIYVSPSDYDTFAEFIEVGTDNLDLDRPLYFKGCNPSSSCHAMVVDGYELMLTGTYFHVLMGAGGSHDGWYLIDYVNGFVGGIRFGANVYPYSGECDEDGIYPGRDETDIDLDDLTFDWNDNGATSWDLRVSAHPRMYPPLYVDESDLSESEFEYTADELEPNSWYTYEVTINDGAMAGHTCYVIQFMTEEED